MRTEISAQVALDADGTAGLAFSVAAAASYARERESFTVTQRGRVLESRTIADQHGTLLYLVDVEPGPLRASYSAVVDGAADGATAQEFEEIDQLRYLRPSRYCESDTLTPTAIAQFGGLQGRELLEAVSSWVGVNLAYIPGSSLPTDGALSTLLGRRGICRDYAHLVVAFLRALDVPARVVSAYAPGLSPMDFHAVAEALIDGQWRVVDATAMAPRTSLVRIATGRDAADTAFLSVRGGPVRLNELSVTAVADELPTDDLHELVTLH